jgi:two-component system, NtrC family, response regulator AtoC
VTDVGGATGSEPPEASSEVAATEVHELPGSAGAGDVPPYLLVFTGHAARAVPLPASGTVVLGRAADATVRLDEPKVSRYHAALEVRAGQTVLRDLGSHNGTYVDGVRAAGEVALRSGAVIAIGATQLVLHGGSARRQRRCELPALRDQVEDEVERASLQERAFAVMALRAEGKGEALAAALLGELRAIDRLAVTGGDSLVFLPEVDAGEAAAGAARLLTVAAAAVPAVRAGWALWPRDAADADGIVAVARAAAQAAEPGKLATAAAAVRRIELGARTVLIADEAMARVYALLERVAAVDLPVLILGETGTGKELAAAAVHHFSARRDRPRVTFNCAALPDTLAESELFGHERGAFSGAIADKVGLLEAAHLGTVFLDEVGELSPTVQAKLLRVLETHSFNRVGSVAERTIDVRLVAASNRDLLAEVEAGRFRRDLYYRLSAATLWLPPLRDRRREIAILAEAFLEGARRAARRDPAALTEEAVRRLVACPWPGNVRELRNCIEFLAATVPGDLIDAASIERYLQRTPRAHEDAAAAERATADERTPAEPASAADPHRFRPIKEEVRELERARMLEALQAARGNQTMAAALIEMPLRTFVAKLKQYAIDARAVR